MSLNEVYRLAHSAECRLRISTDRPDRNLRVVVGHLMHFESLQLRIVEIEHDIGRRERAQKVQFESSSLKRTVSTGQLGRRSPPPPEHEVDGDLTDSDEADEDPDDDLMLTRFESGSKPPQLVEDEGDEFDDSEPSSPEDPELMDIEQALKAPSDDEMAKNIDHVRHCPCHAHTATPEIKHLWALPASAHDKPGITRAVVQVNG